MRMWSGAIGGLPEWSRRSDSLERQALAHPPEGVIRITCLACNRSGQRDVLTGNTTVLAESDGVQPASSGTGGKSGCWASCCFVVRNCKCRDVSLWSGINGDWSNTVQRRFTAGRKRYGGNQHDSVSLVMPATGLVGGDALIRAQL